MAGSQQQEVIGYISASRFLFIPLLTMGLLNALVFRRFVDNAPKITILATMKFSLKTMNPFSCPRQPRFDDFTLLPPTPIHNPLAHAYNDSPDPSQYSTTRDIIILTSPTTATTTTITPPPPVSAPPLPQPTPPYPHPASPPPPSRPSGNSTVSHPSPPPAPPPPSPHHTATSPA